jgi:hypothetical protein
MRAQSPPSPTRNSSNPILTLGDDGSPSSAPSPDKEKQPAPDKPQLVQRPHCDYWEVRDEYGKVIRQERFIPEH